MYRSKSDIAQHPLLLNRTDIAMLQGRNHGIDIGGGSKCETSPRYFFSKFSRGSDRKNKQARPSTNESMEWEVRELLGLWLQQFIIQPIFRVSC